MFSVKTIRPKAQRDAVVRGFAFAAITSIAALTMSVAFTQQALAAADATSAELPLCDTSVNVPGVTDQGVDAIVFNDDGVTEKCLFLAGNQTAAETSTAAATVLPTTPVAPVTSFAAPQAPVVQQSFGGNTAGSGGFNGGGGNSSAFAGAVGGGSGDGSTGGTSADNTGGGSGGGGSQSASTGGGSTGATPADNTGGGGQTQTPGQNGTTSTPTDPNQGARDQLLKDANKDLAQINKNQADITSLQQRLTDLNKSPGNASLKIDLANQIRAKQVKDAQLQAQANTKIAEAGKLTPAEQTQLHSLNGAQLAAFHKLSPQAQKSALAQGAAIKASKACAAGQQASCTPQIKAQLARINESKQAKLSRLTQATAGKGLTPQQRLALVRARQTSASGGLSPFQKQRLAALRSRMTLTKTGSQLTVQQRVAALRANQGKTLTARTQQLAFQRRLALINGARQRQTQLAATNQNRQIQGQVLLQQRVAQFRRAQATRTAQVNSATAFRRQAFFRPAIRSNNASFQTRRTVRRVVQRRRA